MQKNSDLDKWLLSACQYSNKIFSRDVDGISCLKHLEDLYSVIISCSSNATNNQLIQICVVMYTYCEIANNWGQWFSLAKRIPNIEGTGYEGLFYYGLGRMYEEHEDLELSSKFHKKGIYFSKSVNHNEKWLALNCQGLGIVLFRLNLEISIKYLLIAYHLFKKNKEAYFFGCTCSDIGGCYYRLKRLKSIRGHSPLIRQSFMEIFLYKKNIYKNTIKSMKYYLEAIFIHLNHKYPWDLDRFFYSLGCTCLDSKITLFLSLLSFKISLKESKKNQSIRYEALSNYGLGRYYYQTHKYQKALNLLNVADITYEEYLGFSNYYSENKFNIGVMICNTYLKLNNQEVSLQYFNTLELLAKGEISSRHSIPNRINQYNSLLNLAKKLNNEISISFWQDAIKNYC